MTLDDKKKVHESAAQYAAAQSKAAEEHTTSATESQVSRRKVTLWQKLIAISERIRASGDHLPPDLAERHDYYAHGNPKE